MTFLDIGVLEKIATRKKDQYFSGYNKINDSSANAIICIIFDKPCENAVCKLQQQMKISTTIILFSVAVREKQAKYCFFLQCYTRQ